MMKETVLFLIFVIWTTSAARSQTNLAQTNAQPSPTAAYSCPNIVGINNTEPILEDVKTILKEIYADLGCTDTQFADLPSRRNLVLFNTGKHDGEALRIRKAEDKFKRPFVRSEIPMFEFRNSLWVNPYFPVEDAPEIGYVFGVIWQENFVKKEKGFSFETSEKMFNAFRNSSIRRILSGDHKMNQMYRSGYLPFFPVRDKEIPPLQVYHYLHADYAEFMKAFSAYLIQHDPFKELSKDAGL